jgi:hypothetical protein
VWEKVATPTTALQINYFAVNSADHWYVADRKSGFWRSVDRGSSWKQINSGIQSAFGWTIQVAPDGSLIANTCSCERANGNPVGFYLSTNEGDSWKKISDPPDFHLSLAGAQTGCAFDTVAANLICGGYFGHGIAWVSPKYGRGSTTTIVGNPVIGTAYGLGFNPVTKDLWLGTEQKGVFRSADHGFHWQQVSPNATSLDPKGIRNGNIYGMAFDRNGNVLLSSAGGVWKASPSGTNYNWSWVLKNENTSAGKGIGKDAAGNLYWGHNRDLHNQILIYRSADDGATWSEFDSGIPAGLEGHEFVENPADGRVYAVIEDGATNNGWVYRTIGGSTQAPSH